MCAAGHLFDEKQEEKKKTPLTSQDGFGKIKRLYIRAVGLSPLLTAHMIPPSSAKYKWDSCETDNKPVRIEKVEQQSRKTFSPD